jgi:hypothetical protein
MAPGEIQIIVPPPAGEQLGLPPLGEPPAQGTPPAGGTPPATDLSKPPSFN